MTDDNPLADLDLTAWAPPPPPPDLADAVVDRMRQAAAASPVTTAIANPTSSRRWWLVGGLAVAAAAALILIVIGGRTREDGSGSVVADRPRHLELDGVTADLDRGAEIRWRRDRDGVHIEQRRGAVTWHVADDEHLVIAAGATVASVEATGASLRVEVQMNQSDAKVIGVSAVTAAAVALVTVVVYDGHVKVGKDGGEAVAVAAGTTVEVRPKTPPREPDRVADTECQPLVDAKKWADLAECAHRLGSTARASELGEIATREQAAELKLVALRDALADHHVTDAKRLAAEIPVASVYSDEAQRAVAGACDGDVYRTRGGELFVAGRFAASLIAYDNAWVCTNDPRDARLAYLAACRARDGGKARFFLDRAPPGQTAAMLASCRLDPKLMQGCDPEPHRQAGDSETLGGNHAAALVEYEKALECRSDPTVVSHAFEAACRSKNTAKARTYFEKLPEASQKSLASICTDAGVELGMRTVEPTPPGGCDAAALHQEGQDHFTNGEFAAALATFEAAYACKQDGSLVRLMYMAACRTHSIAKAKKYIAMNPQAQQVSLARICLQEGIDPLKP